MPSIFFISSAWGPVNCRALAPGFFSWAGPSWPPLVIEILGASSAAVFCAVFSAAASSAFLPFLSLLLQNTSWFFKAWARNLFSLLFIQIIVSIVLLILFSMDYSSEDLITKFIYIGAIHSLIRANSFVREFLGGISTTISQNVNNFLKK